MKPIDTNSLEFKLGILRAIVDGSQQHLTKLIQKHGRQAPAVFRHIDYMHGLTEALRIFDGPQNWDEAQAAFAQMIATAEAAAKGEGS